MTKNSSKQDHCEQTDATATELRAAWDDMLAGLAEARDAIDTPAGMPPPATERILAEGYRYLMGFAHSAIERAFFEDPAFPTFRHALQILNKGTIDNADAIYFMAPVNGRQNYIVSGQAGDHRHWQGEHRQGNAASDSARKAPQYLIFEASDGCIAGDSGSLGELRPGVKARTGMIDSSTLEVNADGSFEILVAPERPAGHEGNFLATSRSTSRPNPDDPSSEKIDGRFERFACYLSGRQLFYDWGREDPVALTIRPLGTQGTLTPAYAPPAYKPAQSAAALRRAGALVRGQMKFWNEFNTVLLETHGKPDGSDGERFMPRNSFNQPNAASGATGGGQSTNIYAGGVFELEPDEALIVTSRVMVEPSYLGFSMSNLWGESLDFANHQSSLNGFQAEPDSDGAWRFVVAHQDPGIPNWLDTTGHREGYLSPRWAYSTPPPKEKWPTISAEKVAFDRIREYLPSSTRTVSSEEREQQIHARQEHVQRRYRCF